jgi:DNA-binding transcriptional ArsR family regulator
MQCSSANPTPIKATDSALNAMQIESASFIASSVNNTFRQRLISILLANRRLSVKELCGLLNTQQSIVSQHLAMLRKANLVTANRMGKCVIYSVNQQQLNQVLSCFASICNV